MIKRLAELGAADTDRLIGWLIAIGGSFLVLGQTVRSYAQSSDFAVWWSLGGFVLIAIIALLTTLGWVLSARVLRILWATFVVLQAGLQFATFLAFNGADEGTVVPWIWSMEPVAVSMLVLLVRPWLMVAGTVALALLPAASGLLFATSLPAEVLIRTPIHLSNIIFVAIFYGMRARLLRLRAAEEETAKQEYALALENAESARQAALYRMLHDDVLSVLNSGARINDDVPATLKLQTQKALQLLDPKTETNLAGRTHDTAAAARELAVTVQSIDPECVVEATSVVGVVPTEVVVEMIAAAAEAVRNKVRHAGEVAQCRLEAVFESNRICVVISDDGLGFDQDIVDLQRMGIAQSIFARMDCLQGGSAKIASALGAGTRVELTWLKP